MSTRLGSLLLVVSLLASPATAAPKALPILRWSALSAIGLNCATVLYPNKTDVRACGAEAAEWGLMYGWAEQHHPKATKFIYVVMLVGNVWGAGYKIHARWGTQQF